MAALAAIAPVLWGGFRAARMFLRTRDRLLIWRGRGKSNAALRAPFEVVEVSGADVALCVGGYLRPTIYASTDVMKSLEPEEFEAALAHEVSHAQSRDPLRLLFMGSCPDFLQWFSLDAPWRRAFARACEFAADARAARGNQEVALDLASALLKVARLRTFRPLVGDAALDVAVSSAYSSPVDLRARVEALARPLSCAAPDPAWLRPLTVLGLLVVVAALGAAASEPAHGLTESIGRLLAP
jgi:beta-lactamase regulating signal transducer with metallopeptidase domain